MPRVDLSKLAAHARELLAATRANYAALRSILPDEVRTRIEGETEPGSLGWLENHLARELLEGVSGTGAEFELAKITPVAMMPRAAADAFEALTAPARFVVHATAAGAVDAAIFDMEHLPATIGARYDATNVADWLKRPSLGGAVMRMVYFDPGGLRPPS